MLRLRRWLRVLLEEEGATWAAFAALTLFLVAFVYHTWAVISFPYTIEYGEGPVLDWVRTIVHGAWPYKPIDGYPYTFSVYTPLYLWLSAQFLRFGGPSLWGGRAISAVGISVSAGAVYVLARRALVTRKWAAMAALLFLASPFAYRWAGFYRPDALALALSLIGICLVYPASQPANRKRTFLAAWFFVLAFYTKQSFVAAPLACGVVLLLQNRRRGAIWLAAVGLLGGLIFLLLNGMTGGAFFSDVVVGNANPYSFAAFFRFAQGFLSIVGVVAMFALAEWILLWREQRSPLLRTYFLFAALLTFSAGKSGAWENYFLETLVLMCTLSALAWQRLYERYKPWAAVAIAFLVLAQLALYLPGFERVGPVAEAAWLQRLAEVDQELSTRLADVRGPILAEDMGILSANGRPVPIHSFVYTQLSAQGVWDVQPFLADVAAHRFPLLILRQGARADREQYHRFGRAMLSAFERYYDCTEKLNGYEICVPAPPLHPYHGGLAGTIRLVGYDISSTVGTSPKFGTLRAGQPLTVTLLWQAETAPATNYTVFVHLVDVHGARRGQHDGPPREGSFSTSRWRPGDVIRDVHRLTLAADAPPGPYRLLVGMYRPDTGKRLQVVSGPTVDDALIIRGVTAE